MHFVFKPNATDNDTLRSQLRRVVNIQGREEVAFENLAAQLGLEEDFARQVVFDIKVKEANTGRIQNVTTFPYCTKRLFIIMKISIVSYSAKIKVRKSNNMVPKKMLTCLIYY